ncbi:MAG TPA: protein-L-isoaspartate(D-aspartate) O-methyltransferase [Nevskiaceae bacterium]|nr:protein-L-isoaspartate(D-aspartate) O-methyltransferase [Nevskiaceae bacterium]
MSPGTRAAARPADASAAARRRLLAQLPQQGVTDPQVLAALDRIAREQFVDEAFRSRAYENTALPIGHAQTISQPAVVGLMTQALFEGGARPRRVLEIGTGSGYQTAVLAALVETVFTVERLRPLTELARQRLQRLGFRNIHFGYADGSLGWAPYAPYDGIVVTAAAREIPQSLLEQLAPGGRLVVPVGPAGSQLLQCVERGPSGPVSRTLASVSFVPLLTGKA